MVHIVESSRSVQEVAKRLPEAAAARKFGVLGVHDLRQKMNEKGVSFDRDCLVFEVCNPLQAKKVLDERLSISTALPCRISVYEEGGRTKIATMLPTALIALFEAPKLKAVAQEVEAALLEIMKESA